MISIQKTADVFDQSIGALDFNLNRVLKKHEFEYLQAYNVYVKNKEGELMRAIYQMNERNSSSRIKDLKIQQLEEQVNKLRSQNTDSKNQILKLEAKIKDWQKLYNDVEKEREDYHHSALETKKKNKIVTIALGRLQQEYDLMKAKSVTVAQDLVF